MKAHPCASVVIPCLNEAGHIGPCLDALAAQKGTAAPIEILVVDGGSDDGTLDVLRERADSNSSVRLLHNPDRVTPVAMNLGVDAALSDTVIILGAHAEVAPDFVRRNLDALRAHPESACVGGVVEQVHGDDVSRRIGMAMSSPFGVGNARFRTGGVAGHVDTVAFGAYRKAVLEEIGGFDVDLVRNQDDELNFRLTESGWRIWFDPRIRSRYHARSSYARLFGQYRQYGYWKVFVNRKHGTVTTWRQLAPMMLVLASIGLAPLVLIDAFADLMDLPSIQAMFGWALSWLLAIWLMWSLGAAVALVAGRVSFRDMPGVFRSFYLLHVAYGRGYLEGIWRFLMLRRDPAPGFKSLTR